jgi:hypothetical protein
MAQLVFGKKYRMSSMVEDDAWFDDFKNGLLNEVILVTENNGGRYVFKNLKNGELLTPLDGYRVVEIGELPPPEAEAYTMPEIHEAAGFTNVPHQIVYSESMTIKVTGEDADTVTLQVPRQFESGAVRDSNAGKPFVHDLLGYTRLRFGYHMAKNATRYGDGNFKKGIPTDVALESLDRHLAQYISGQRDYDHLSAILFNLQLVMMNEEKEGVKPDHYYAKS